MSSTPTPTPGNSPSSPGEKMSVYARAAANLYGIIHIDDFFKILEVYYGEGSLSKETVYFFFLSKKNLDPIYYVQDELIVHSSISSDQISDVLMDIQENRAVRTNGQRRILPEKEFLAYADPFYYENTNGTREMESFLRDELGLPQEDAREILMEMVYLCRSGADPTYLMNALKRREIAYDHHNYDLDLISYGAVMEGEIRLWERLGFTGKELQIRN